MKKYFVVYNGKFMGGSTEVEGEREALSARFNSIPRDINIIINLFHRTGESDVYFIRKYNNRMTVDEISNIHDKMKKVQLRYGEYEVTKVTVEDSKTIKIMCIYP